MTMMAEADTQPVPYLIFRLGSQQYALVVDHVIEVAAMVELVNLPHAQPAILGVANRHGHVLPMLDLRQVFDQRAARIDIATLFIVAQHNDRQMGLVVDEVQQIGYFDAAVVAQATSAEKYVQGIVTHDGNIIQLIALPQLIAAFLPQEMLESNES
jgi:chemotaxis signal transduction protein